VYALHNVEATKVPDWACPLNECCCWGVSVHVDLNCFSRAENQMWGHHQCIFSIESEKVTTTTENKCRNFEKLNSMICVKQLTCCICTVCALHNT